MAKNTKKIFAGIFALSCAFILAGCDKAESLPTNYNDKIVNKNDLYKNEMGVIYDAIASGKTDKTIDQFLYRVAVNEFGYFYDTEVNGTTVEGIKSIVKKSDADILAFANAHEEAFCYKSDEQLGSDKDKQRIQRVKDFEKHVEDEIKEVFYNDIKSGSYNNDYSLYQEERLVQARRAELYEVLTPNTQWYEAYLTHELKKENVENYVHIDCFKDYIERKLIPTIYKDKMVEEHIMSEKNYPVLGRAYGRKVNVLKLTHSEKTIDFADKLIQAFTDKYILNNESKTDQFSSFVEVINDAWRGFKNLEYNNGNKIFVELGENSEAYKLVEEILGEPETIDLSDVFEDASVVKYWEKTEIGSILKDYKLAQKAEGNRFATSEETSALNKFTNSGKHPKEQGLLSEVYSAAGKTCITDGWFVKNGGLTDLPSTIRDRLFNINVSNTVDNFKPEEMETSTNHNYDAKNYVRYINSNYYLTPAKSQQAIVNPRNFVIHDDGTNSFYIVNIEQASSTSKLKLDSTVIADYQKAESAAREISRVLGTKDSYTNNAYAEYIKKYDVVYHDQDVYDYFKSTYPELFD